MSFAVTRDTPTEVAFEVRREGHDPFDVWFRCPTGGLAMNGDVLLAAGLLPAMALGERLHLPLPVSSEMLAAAHTLQDVFSTWYPSLNRIPVEAAEVLRRPRRAPRRPRGTAVFFSGGADSFFSALKHRSRVTHLVLVHGFDIELDDIELRTQVDEHLAAAAAGLDLPLVTIETNLKTFADRHLCYWGLHYHGAALATVGRLLRRRFGEVIAGSTYPYPSLFAWGSHPLTDPLWAAGDPITFTHDACEADRVVKLATIAESGVAMDHLRICFENRGGAYNCGRCAKCIRTMVGFRVGGYPGACRTLPSEIDMNDVRNMEVGKVGPLVRHTEFVRHLRASGRDPELLEALEVVTARLDPTLMNWPANAWTEAIPELWSSRPPSGP